MENQNIIKKKPIRLNLRWECDQKVEKILEQAVRSGKYRSQNDFIKTVILSYGEKELNQAVNFHVEEIENELKESEKRKESESALNPFLL